MTAAALRRIASRKTSDTRIIAVLRLPQMLLLQQSHLCHQQVRRVCRRPDLWLRSKDFVAYSTTQLEGCLKLRIFSTPNTRQLTQLIET